MACKSCSDWLTCYFIVANSYTATYISFSNVTSASYCRFTNWSRSADKVRNRRYSFIRVRESSARHLRDSFSIDWISNCLAAISFVN